eukprot:SAG11_NODE_2011_length_3925_cov_7.509148_4_plen_90_part_00
MHCAARVEASGQTLDGVGYTYTGGKGGHAIAALLEKDLAPTLVGQDVRRRNIVLTHVETLRLCIEQHSRKVSVFCAVWDSLGVLHRAHR